MDCVRPQSVVLNLPNGRRESVTLAPCELRVVNLKASKSVLSLDQPTGTPRV